MKAEEVKLKVAEVHEVGFVFHARPNRPQETAHGLFRHPETCDAVMRFPNRSRQLNPNPEPDARGMAVKVIGAEAEHDNEHFGGKTTE